MTRFSNSRYASTATETVTYDSSLWVHHISHVLRDAEGQ